MCRIVPLLISHGVFVVIGICFLGVTPLLAQELGPAPLPGGVEAGRAGSDASAKTSGGEDADLDSILDLDLKSLGSIAVRESTFTDPIVEGVSKTAEKASEAPGIVDVITAKDIEDFGAKNLYEALEWATSVYMTGSFMYPRNIASIRGDLAAHEGNHVLVLINGRPFRECVGGGFNSTIYTAFPIHMIERIEVIRGPGSVLYGTNAFTGVINVVTKNPKEPTIHASVLGGSYGWQSYSLAAGNGNESRGYYGGAMYNRSKGWPFTATLEDMTSDTGLYGEDNIGVFAMYRNNGFTANLYVSRPRVEEVGSVVVWPTVQTMNPRVFTDFGYLREIDDRQSIDLHFTYNYLGGEVPGAIPQYTFLTTAHSFLLEGTYRRELWDGMDMIAGGVADIHVGNLVMGPYTLLGMFREIWYSAYLQFDYRVNDWLKLVGGMQGNMPGIVEGGIVPRAGVIVSLNENWTTKFLYGEAFRSPLYAERYINVPFVIAGNPDLVPEVIQTFDVQLAYHTDDYRLAATYFHSDYFDSIIRTGTLPETYVNNGGLMIQGVELENEWQLSDRLRWVGSVTYQNSARDGEHNVTEVPNWMAKMGLAYHNDRGLHVALMDVFYGARSTPAGALHVNPEPDEYHLASLNMRLDLNRRFHWDTNRRMELQFLIQNLFNEPINHVEFQRGVINTLPAGPGRAFYGGFTMAY
ncbi:MAG: TonB-dependent receptor [Pirellulales bacterium]|nr:TonB-dependent receptor [Pirellulales bacterium]